MLARKKIFVADTNKWHSCLLLQMFDFKWYGNVMLFDRKIDDTVSFITALVKKNKAKNENKKGKGA